MVHSPVASILYIPQMQEDTEAIVPKLLTGFQVLLRRLVSLRLCGAHKKKQQ